MIPLESAEEDVTLDSQLFTAFRRKKQQHKWLVTNLTYSNNLDVLYADFIDGQAIAGSDRSYQSEVVLSLSEWRIESNFEMQYIQEGGMFPGKIEY